jgi:transcriptional regulator with XRE-family HTH domain
METNEFFIANNVSPAMMVRLERIRRGWRQVDLAEKAGITQAEVSSLERGLYVIPAARRRVLSVLELLNEEKDNASQDR